MAVRAGIGKGTIYLYFDSKQALFEEVVKKTMVPEKKLPDDFVENYEGSISELLSTHLHHMYSMLSREEIPPMVALVLGETSRFPELADFWFNEMVSQHHDLLRKIVRKGKEKGEFRQSAPDHNIQILIAPALFSAIWKLQFDRHSPIDMEDYANEHIDFVLRGLKA